MASVSSASRQPPRVSDAERTRHERLVIRAATRCSLSDFPALPKPGPDSWLAHNRESGQSFEAFASRPDRHVPDSRHYVIYLQPFIPSENEAGLHQPPVPRDDDSPVLRGKGGLCARGGRGKRRVAAEAATAASSASSRAPQVEILGDHDLLAGPGGQGGGDFGSSSTVFLSGSLMGELEVYVAAFFQMTVKVRAPKSLTKLAQAAERAIADGTVTVSSAASKPPAHPSLPGAPGQPQLVSRVHPKTRHLQYFTRSLFGALQAVLPSNAFCMEGITTLDLFSRYERSFVFGSAKLSGRVGVYSFYRHRPWFYADKAKADAKARARASANASPGYGTALPAAAAGRRDATVADLPPDIGKTPRRPHAGSRGPAREKGPSSMELPRSKRSGRDADRSYAGSRAADRKDRRRSDRAAMNGEESSRSSGNGSTNVVDRRRRRHGGRSTRRGSSTSSSSSSSSSSLSPSSSSSSSSLPSSRRSSRRSTHSMVSSRSSLTYGDVDSRGDAVDDDDDDRDHDDGRRDRDAASDSDSGDGKSDSARGNEGHKRHRSRGIDTGRSRHGARSSRGARRSQGSESYSSHADTDDAEDERRHSSKRRQRKHARRGSHTYGAGTGGQVPPDDIQNDGGYSYGSETLASPGPSATEMRLLLFRALKTTVHEIAHMFCIKHCVEYNCAMNGSIDVNESDLRSPHLCPTCLRKLQHAIGFDIERRYADLAVFYAKRGLWEEETFCKRRLEVIAAKVGKWTKFNHGKSKK